MRRFVTATDNVVAARSKVAPGEMFRAITRTVFVVQAVASSFMKRIDEANAASAKSPTLQLATVTLSRLVMPGASDGKSQDTSAWNSRVPTGA